MHSLTSTLAVYLDQRIETMLLNDAIRAEGVGTMTREQAMLLDTFDAPVVDRLAEDEDGIYTEEQARVDIYAAWDEQCHHGMALWLCDHPVFHYPADM